MARYTFKKKDLAPLRKFLERPDTRRLLQHIVPVKKLPRGPKYVEELPETLPFRIRTRHTPDGVPLHEVAALMRERVPGVKSVFMRGGRVMVEHDRHPATASRAAMRKLVREDPALAKLAERAKVAPRPQPAPPGRPPVYDRALREKLLDPRLSDAEWLSLFRRYMVAQLSDEVERGPHGTW